MIGTVHTATPIPCQTDSDQSVRQKPDGSFITVDKVTNRILSVKYPDGRTAQFSYREGVLDSVRLPNDITLNRDSKGRWLYQSGRPVGGKVFVNQDGVIDVLCENPMKAFTIYTSGVKECLDCQGNKLFISEDDRGVRIGRDRDKRVLFTTNPYGVFHSYRYDRKGRLIEIQTVRSSRLANGRTLQKSETLVSLDGRLWFNPDVSMEPMITGFKVSKKGSLITTSETGQPILEERPDGTTVKLTGERTLSQRITLTMSRNKRPR